MRIAIDAMGGDRAPAEIVEGAVAAARDFRVAVSLVGDKDTLSKYLQGIEGGVPDSVTVHHASQVVDMGEAPALAMRKKRDSSVVVATRLHAEGHADAVLSAGNTGAASAAAILALRPIAGVDRPGIATVFPTQKSPLVLMDAGANVDCRPRHLSEFAIMGAAYARAIHGVIPGEKSGVAAGQVPSVGLLSIGEEEGKGNELVKTTYKLLHEGAGSGFYSYFGNVEGRDIAFGTVDVVVCDGFVGNVVLKTAEGFAKMFTSSLKEAFLGDLRSKIGAMLLKPALQKFRSKIDYAEYGGAVLLGVNGVCIICHGSSDRRSIYSAIRIAKQTVESDVTGMIRGAIAQVRAANEASDAALGTGDSSGSGTDSTPSSGA
jgi:glycerol-3-phosphate acyltransferase PlsX